MINIKKLQKYLLAHFLFEQSKDDLLSKVDFSHSEIDGSFIGFNLISPDGALIKNVKDIFDTKVSIKLHDDKINSLVKENDAAYRSIAKTLSGSILYKMRSYIIALAAKNYRKNKYDLPFEIKRNFSIEHIPTLTLQNFDIGYNIAVCDEVTFRMLPKGISHYNYICNFLNSGEVILFKSSDLNIDFPLVPLTPSVENKEVKLITTEDNYELFPSTLDCQIEIDKNLNPLEMRITVRFAGFPTVGVSAGIFKLK